MDRLDELNDWWRARSTHEQRDWKGLGIALAFLLVFLVVSLSQLGLFATLGIGAVISALIALIMGRSF